MKSSLHPVNNSFQVLVTHNTSRAHANKTMPQLFQAGNFLDPKFRFETFCSRLSLQYAIKAYWGRGWLSVFVVDFVYTWNYYARDKAFL